MEWMFWSIIFAAICYKMAETRGRDVTWGAISGAVFGILTIIYYWIVGDAQELREKKMEKEFTRKEVPELKRKVSNGHK